ncbi:MAG: hypothetical protein SFY32_00980 [Bacteroidota bacterium]|nr:hypothetical protein [Bacteroidota bacterium]
MEAQVYSESKSTTNWNQVYALLGLNAAVVISWIAYHNYQPKVLELFNFQELALFLVVAQAVILVCIPPIAGAIGDYMIKSNGNRFLVFMVGTSVTAMTFMAVAFTVGTANVLSLTPALPVMIVIWLISMNIFHSPANSMLELFAPTKELPLAMAMLAMTTELLYAIEPIVVWFVDLIGPVLTFVTGGVLLIVTGYFFRRTTQNLTLSREYNETKQNVQNNFPVVLIAGMVLGLVTAILMNVFPDLLAQRLATYSHTALGGSHFVSLILGLSALAALPMAKVIEKLGAGLSLTLGLIGCFVFISGIYFVQNEFTTMLFMVLLAVSYSLSTVSAFPFALYNLSPKMVTFGAGIFFGSMELADGLMNVFQKL